MHYTYTSDAKSSFLKIFFTLVTNSINSRCINVIRHGSGKTKNK